VVDGKLCSFSGEQGPVIWAVDERGPGITPHWMREGGSVSKATRASEQLSDLDALDWQTESGPDTWEANDRDGEKNWL
jgi:hypothetical protein